jgi:hypothetical protein
MHHALRGKRRGFVLVYTLLIASLCSAAAIACFRLQIQSRDNNVASAKLMQRTDSVQRDREYLLTAVDDYIYAGMSEQGCAEIRELFQSGNGFKALSGESTAEYILAKDALYLCYYRGGKFVMEELYRYSSGEKGVVYIPAAFSYKKGIVIQ